jgi:hypothetical protein
MVATTDDSQEICMSGLATLAMNAHGGLDRWRQFKTVSAHLLQGGVLWKLKGHAVSGPMVKRAVESW